MSSVWSFHYDCLKNTNLHTRSCTSYLVTFNANIAFSPSTSLWGQHGIELFSPYVYSLLATTGRPAVWHHLQCDDLRKKRSLWSLRYIINAVCFESNLSTLQFYKMNKHQYESISRGLMQPHCLHRMTITSTYNQNTGPLKSGNSENYIRHSGKTCCTEKETRPLYHRWYFGTTQNDVCYIFLIQHDPNWINFTDLHKCCQRTDENNLTFTCL